ncbi:MAG: 3-isopropylmalate dehydratase small subunit, partial [Desulfobacula sp.]|nr:3-isopropylmalate dehydratase small subunit [Desulfobacula sp.]
MKEFKGNILFLDRSDINTDEIIPAKYLTEIEKTALKQHLFEDLKLDGFNPGMDVNKKAVIVTRENFGCGSSREHAPWALEVNNINVVIAQSFARIFRQNMFNCGMLAIELSEDKINHIFKEFGKNDTKISVDMEVFEIMVQSKDQTKTIKFQI